MFPRETVAGKVGLREWGLAGCGRDGSSSEREIRSGDFLSALSPGTHLGSDKCRTEQEGGNLTSGQKWKSRHEAES